MAKNTIETEIDLDAYAELLEIADAARSLIRDGGGTIHPRGLLTRLSKAVAAWDTRMAPVAVIEDSTANGFDPTVYGDDHPNGPIVTDERDEREFAAHGDSHPVLGDLDRPCGCGEQLGASGDHTLRLLHEREFTR